jgi:cytochrome c peroxidase
MKNRPSLKSLEGSGIRAKSRQKVLKLWLLAAFASLIFIQLASLALGGQQINYAAQIRLGERLFMDDRFSSPNGDLQSSCASCHMLNQDPQGVRAYTDFLARSWVSSRMQDPRRDGLRNAPTILDSSQMPRLHFDGEFGSLEELVKGTLSSRTLGWLPGEEDKALDQVYRVIRDDAGENSYRGQFNLAYGVDVTRITRDEALKLIAQAVSDYVRTLNSRKSSPYDGFISANGLPSGPAEGESPKAFATRMLALLSSLEAKGQLRLSAGFGPNALKGMRVFLLTEGNASAGNCVSCHVPPLFTDFSFHNTGITQREYDRLHGEGSFAALPIPDVARANRPSPQFREIPSRAKPGLVDLGYWNFVKLGDPTLRRAGESESDLLERMIATFKTPTLRNLAYSFPYMHNGAYSDLEIALNEIAHISEMARAKKVRAGDEELARTKITKSDIVDLIAFLDALNDNRSHPNNKASW